jgi:hypothetical protein
MKDRTIWIQLGKYFLDLSKLVFASMFLGAIVSGGVEPFMMFIFGIGATTLLALSGFILVASGKEEKQ